MFVRLLLLVLLGYVSSTQAQTPTDSLTPADTIGVMRQRALFVTTSAYSFHAARQLSDLQLAPLLLRTADSTINRLVRRSKRRYALTAPVFFSSYGLMLGTTRAIAVNQESALAVGLLLGGVATLTDGMVLALSAPTPMRRAIGWYNQLVGLSDYGYVRPVPMSPTSAYPLTISDTVSIRLGLLNSRYTYRGIQLVPDVQLQAAMQSLRDPFITEGLRQNRLTRGISGVVGGLSAYFLITYYFTRFVFQAAGGRVSATNPLVYVSFGGLAISLGLNRLADRTTRQVVQRYNQQLASQP